MSICRHSSINWSLPREAALPVETRFSGLCRYGCREVKIRVNTRIIRWDMESDRCGKAAVDCINTVFSMQLSITAE